MAPSRHPVGRPRRPAGPRAGPRQVSRARLDTVDDAERYRAIVEQSLEPLFVANRERRIVWASQAFESILGYPPQSLVGTEILRLVRPDDLAALAETIERIDQRPGATARVNFRVRAADGSWHEMETSATNHHDVPAIGGVVVSMRDVTERVLAERALAETEQRYRDLVARARDIVFTMDLDGTFRSLNPAAEVITGYSVDELLGMSALQLVVREEREHATEALARVLRGGQERLDLPIETKDGRRAFVEIATHVVRGRDGEPHVEGIVRDVTERHALEEELRRAAIHDPLTGLPNRVLFLDRLSQALVRRRAERAVVAVMLLDLDGFKLVNDQLGHDSGDELLVEVARRFRSLTRRGETLARLGGDEFALVAEVEHGRAGVAALAERLLSAFAEPFAVDTERRDITGSLGIAIARKGSTPVQLLRDADTAMYRAKDAHRGGFSFFDTSMRQELLRELGLKQDLAQALREHRLEVHYQPIQSLQDDHLIAVEALVRWPHPEQGWIPPDAFIPLAEQTGLIIPLGRYVLDEAAGQAKRWRAQAPDALPLGVFVNVSAPELAEPGFASGVTETLRRHGLSPSDVALELTERAFINSDDETVTHNLEQLSAAGVRLILDDFGTGYSSLSSLKRFQFAAIKIDRSFISSITTSHAEAPITRAVVGLGKSLGIDVIAEGIETDVQLDYLRGLKCEAAQGFRLARPQPASEISTLISPSEARARG